MSLYYIQISTVLVIILFNSMMELTYIKSWQLRATMIRRLKIIFLQRTEIRVSILNCQIQRLSYCLNNKYIPCRVFCFTVYSTNTVWKVLLYGSSNSLFMDCFLKNGYAQNKISLWTSSMAISNSRFLYFFRKLRNHFTLIILGLSKQTFQK